MLTSSFSHLINGGVFSLLAGTTPTPVDTVVAVFLRPGHGPKHSLIKAATVSGRGAYPSAGRHDEKTRVGNGLRLFLFVRLLAGREKARHTRTRVQHNYPHGTHGTIDHTTRGTGPTLAYDGGGRIIIIICPRDFDRSLGTAVARRQRARRPLVATIALTRRSVACARSRRRLRIQIFRTPSFYIYIVHPRQPLIVRPENCSLYSYLTHNFVVFVHRYIDSGKYTVARRITNTFTLPKRKRAEIGTPPSPGDIRIIRDYTFCSLFGNRSRIHRFFYPMTLIEKALMGRPWHWSGQICWHKLSSE